MVLNFSPLPPPRPGRDFYPFVPVRSVIATELVITSETIVGIWVHWNGSRHEPCREPDCSACENGAQQRWKGYVSCYLRRPVEINRARYSHVITELTENAGLALGKNFDHLKTFRGLPIKLARREARANSALEVFPSDWVPGCQLPPALAVIRFVFKLYGYRASLPNITPQGGKVEDTRPDEWQEPTLN